MSRLYLYYKNKVIPNLIKKFNYSSIMAVPQIIKITLNMGIGKSIINKKILDYAIDDLTKISGQKPIITIAKKSIASFKIRKGYPIGCKVTLRGRRKWDFFDKLITIVIPRIRDFRGMSRKSFDGRGNYSLGIREQIIFPEINYEKIDSIRGMDITITTNSKSNQEGECLLTEFDFPFQK
ncbi:50S ribosomal protein L5 [Buchnera aphidicola]|uniref:Large ribosomal subunit protein uL5 n=2 Tax=Buchnera aphidicola (Cinara cedri) TaxID=261318 RepID=RL5_BUCCC|nr:50S ribosomal protein L5 [Buchnera aphidicola]Q057B6.1 RecName: Full=Large ribosomal subunit protein uL5; AltName: Full=50S ribosomal protein L5 [Buchnera aphidicola BCc]AAW72695.1 50S ribosomal protein L5 [Buchnera aphidicola (Cinara cedri)]ABJ90783.1 50S ribosomal protein L5 [Buchnera aphidicola BCc]